MKKDFGLLKNQNGYSNNPCALTSVLYDLENKIVIHSLIKESFISEQKLAIEHIEKLKSLEYVSGKKIIILFDRGYPSLKLITALETNKINYIM